MDPITGAIVAYFASGIAVGAAEVGKNFIVETYNALIAALKQKCGVDSRVIQAVENLAEEPDFEPNHTALAKRVENANVAQDPDLVKLAEDLLKTLKETPQGQTTMSKYNIQISGGKVGIIGDRTHIEGGLHL